MNSPREIGSTTPLPTTFDLIWKTPAGRSALEKRTARRSLSSIFTPKGEVAGALLVPGVDDDGVAGVEQFDRGRPAESGR